MRRILIYLIAAATAMSMWSCVIEQAPELNVNADTKIVPAEGGNVTVAIDCNKEGWTVSLEDTGWAHVKEIKRLAGGSGTVVVSCDENPKEESRLNSFTVTCENVVKSIVFTQAKAEPDPITAQKVTGLYGYKEANYFASLAESSQLSLLYLSDGTVSARFLYPLTMSVTEVTGIPSNVAKGNVVSLGLTVIENSSKTADESRRFKAVMRKDNMVWLKDVNDASVYLVVELEEDTK